MDPAVMSLDDGQISKTILTGVVKRVDRRVAVPRVHSGTQGFRQAGMGVTQKMKQPVSGTKDT